MIAYYSWMYNQPTGRAIIQVAEDSKENVILLLPGANHSLTDESVNHGISQFSQGDFLVLQNEVGLDQTLHALSKGRSRGLVIALSLAPCPSNSLTITQMDLSKNVDILFLNETEADMLIKLLGFDTQDMTLDQGTRLMNLLDGVSVLILTLGAQGCLLYFRGAGSNVEKHSFSALDNVKVLDSTGAGDTFAGYFVGLLATRMDATGAQIRNVPLEILQDCVRLAITASGMACEEKGALASIPTLEAVRARSLL
jgi:ribokinase